MKLNLQSLIKQPKNHSNPMDSYSQQILLNQTYNQFDYIQSLLSLSQSFQRPHSDKNIYTSKTTQKLKSSLNFDIPQQQHPMTSSNCQQQLPSSLQPTLQPLSDHKAHLTNFMIDQLMQNTQTRIKEEIKTFPNFVFRTFSKHLRNYESLYSENDGLKQLKEYLQTHFGAKHYTLQQLNLLFKCSPMWNAKLNRGVLSRILARYSYKDIFSNSQRKKKKTYLIMAKVYKMRCRSWQLCSRVQCQ